MKFFTQYTVVEIKLEKNTNCRLHNSILTAAFKMDGFLFVYIVVVYKEARNMFRNKNILISIYP